MSLIINLFCRNNENIRDVISFFKCKTNRCNSRPEMEEGQNKLFTFLIFEMSTM